MSQMRRSMLIASRMCAINVLAANTSLIDAEVMEGDSYSTQIVCDEGYSIYEITIKMGGVDITSTAYDPTYNMISIASVTDDVDIECYAMHTMPSDYIRVDGIKNPSNAYLKTGEKITNNRSFELDATIVGSGTIAATRETGNVNDYGTGFHVYDTYVRAYRNKSLYEVASYTSGNRYYLKVDWFAKKLITNGYTRDWARDASAIEYSNMCIWGSGAAGGIANANSAGTICHKASIYDYSTTSYVRYYIPCLNDSGVAGFWDAARGIFQGSSNSTAFEACYTQRGLVFQLDGINKGATADAWTDLVGGIVFNKNGNVTSISDGWNFPRGNVNDTLTSSENPHDFNGTPYTIEVCFKTSVSGATSQILIQMPKSKSLVFAQSGAGPFTFRQGYNRYSATLKKGVRRTVSLNNDIGIAEGNELTKTTIDSWNTSSSYIKIGSGDSSNSFVGDIYAIRIYNVNLTKEEILLNQRMDNKRFNLGLTI